MNDWKVSFISREEKRREGFQEKKEEERVCLRSANSLALEEVSRELYLDVLLERDWR